MRFQVRVFMFFISICLMLFVAGCGGKKKPTPGPAPMPEQNQQVQAPESSAPEKKKIKKIKKKKKDPAAEENADELPEELRIPEVTLPANSSQWTEKEIVYIRSAQKDLYDSTIQELISRLDYPETADAAAKLLDGFVRSVIPGALAQEEKLRAKAEQLREMDGDPQNPSNRPSPQNQPITYEIYQLTQMQVRQIFEALSSSTCDTAKRTSAAFLAGTIQTDDNKSGLDAVIAGYAEKAQNGKITKEEEDFLLAFLLIPEKGVKLAAEYAEVEPPEVEPVELDQNGNPIQNQDPMNAMRGNHQPIEVAPEKWVQFKYIGGNGNMAKFTPQEVQKQILAKYCPFSSANFRARIAAEITGQEVMAATEEEQAFLLNEVLDKFIMKRDFANAVAHILIYKQPDLDDKWKSTIEENLLKSCKALTQNHFKFIDEKTLEEYKKAVQAKAAQLASEKQRRLEAEQKAEAPTSSAQVPVSLLSKKAQLNQNQNRTNNFQNQAIQYPPLVELMMNPDECSALEKEVWSPEMRAILLSRLEESFGALVTECIANMPEPGSKDRLNVPTLDKDGLSALEMYMTIPCIENRAQVYNFLDKAWLLGPEPFRQFLFDKVETEPGFLMVVKSLDRRVAPKEKERKNVNVSKNKNRVVKEREKSKGTLLRERKAEVGAQWMNQVYDMVCKWCWKFSQAAQTEKDLLEINRILKPKLPKAEPPKLPDELKLKFQPLPGLEVVSFYTNSDPEMSPIAPSSGLKITFIELRGSSQLAKLSSAYKSKIPHIIDRGKLGGKFGGMNSQSSIADATWLEKFEVNEKTGRCESIDILLAPSQGEHLMDYSGDINQPRKGAEPLSIYVLVMEMDDLTGEHISNLGDRDDSTSDSGDDEEDDSEE